MHSVVQALISALLALAATAEEAWPEASPETRPWLRLIVPTTTDGLDEVAGSLDSLASAGLGGIEIEPREYAAAWPSPGWAERAIELSTAAAEIGLEVDFALHAGPEPRFEGPDFQNFRYLPFESRVEGGRRVEIDLPAPGVDTLGAWPGNAPPIDLSPALIEGPKLAWDAPPGSWSIYGLLLEPADSVLAPAEGEGFQRWLDFSIGGITSCFSSPPRCLSFRRSRAAMADVSTSFHDAFRRYRGYDLREQLPALLGGTNLGTSDRVIADFRATLGDLHLASLDAFHQKTRELGALSRITLRGNPGHPVDLHAVADIPGVDSPLDPPFASSAAHFALKPLVSGTFDPGTEDDEESWRSTIHQLWLRGINQVVLPPLPASMAAGLPALAGEITRTQSILQSGAPDPDLLLYFPYHDFLNSRGGLPDDPDDRLGWLRSSGFGHAMEAFDRAGIHYDIVSDRLLATATADGRRVIIGGLTYSGIVIPEVRCLPETTAVVLEELSRRGARIGVMGAWPSDVPGYPSPDIRRGTLVQALQNITQPIEEDDPLLIAAALGCPGEDFARHGLRGVRRHHADGHHYWIVNPSTRRIDAEITLSRPAKSVMLLDPTLPTRAGFVAVSIDPTGSPSFRLVLEPGETRVIRSFREAREGAAWMESSTPTLIGGEWTLRFLDLPSDLEITAPYPASWRSLGHPLLGGYEGAVEYEITLHAGDRPTRDAVLSFGSLRGSARVFIDDEPAGALFAAASRLIPPPWEEGSKHRLRLRFESPASGPAGLAGPLKWIPLLPAEP
ncbi:MAG: hypothetical protein MUF31_03515 [Akkermansiaceae bacterium]|nr:hypothetical protein [Akkermansiaceae bacterium]